MVKVELTRILRLSTSNPYFNENSMLYQRGLSAGTTQDAS